MAPDSKGRLAAVTSAARARCEIRWKPAYAARPAVWPGLNAKSQATAFLGPGASNNVRMFAT